MSVTAFNRRRRELAAKQKSVRHTEEQHTREGGQGGRSGNTRKAGKTKVDSRN